MNQHPSEVPTVLPGARRSLIAEYVRSRGGASVQELAEALLVSSDTIRRDLDLLDSRGLLGRTHGGAIALPTPAAQLGSVDERGERQSGAKRVIAAAAARLIRDGETVLVNGGSTTLAVAQALPTRDIALVTCSPAVAKAADAVGRGVFLLGGRWYPSFGVVVGPVVLPGVTGLRADVLILGVAGISADGISIANIEEAEMLADMLGSTARVVVVADSSKFDRSAFAVLAGLDRIDVLVTERAPAEHLATALTEAGVDLVVAR